MNAISVKEIEHGVAVAEREGLGEYLYQEPVSKKCSRRSRSRRSHQKRTRKRCFKC
ncbi:CotG/ExsB N-terminal domain-containing protein [Bacillus velezensis]|uniref:CotG/ExsB N-terminal domain-containing protein n=1 Tax=Bacillus velezensis TaxID=492670 RepID=UPI003F56E8BC